MALSPQNLALVGRDRETYTMSADELERVLNAAHERGASAYLTRQRREEAEALATLRDRGMKLSPAQNAKADSAVLAGRRLEGVA